MKKSKIILVAMITVLTLCLTGCFNNKVSNEKPVQQQAVEMVDVALYLPNDNASGVKANIIKMNKKDVTPKNILEELIKTEVHRPYSIFPENLQVKDIKVKDGIAYVEFNSAFLEAGSGGSLTERLELASIVTTLTEFKDIKAVLFIVDGDQVTEISGHVDMSDPLERKPELIK